MTDGRPNERDDEPHRPAAGERKSGPVAVPDRQAARDGGRGAPLVERGPDAQSRLRDAVVLETPSLDRVLHTVLHLNRQVSVEMYEEDIVHAYVEALKSLFPGRRVLVRLVSSETGQLSLAYATARLREERRERLELSRRALQRHELPLESVRPQHVRVVDERTPVFEDGSHGFDVPMMDGHRLVGILTVEYPLDVTEPTDDRAIIGQIALQLAAALRNARLLRESVYLRDYLGKLLDHANAPIVVIGRKREIRVVNRALLELTGRTREELLGEDFVSLVPEEERNHLLPVFVNALRGRPTSNFEIKLPRGDGTYARLAANVASILSSDGEVEGVIAIARDLTEVRELEQQVIQAEKLATLGQLAAGVVHELNNPLTSISVYGEYLLKKTERADGDPGDAEKLHRIVQSAERILRFTRDLVTYARPSTEEPRFLSIHEELDQAVVFCEHVFSETGASVEKNYAEQVPPVYGVRGQLHQVFINLITNACHAMPDGAGRLVIATDRVDEERLRVCMTDNGPGIPPDYIDRVFEPFFTTKGEGKGTGLGLSIVRNIIQQHGGAIEVYSEPGQGTTFHVVLPCQSGPS